MLRSWKLLASSSISGLSRIVKPNWLNIRAISAIDSMLGWNEPRRIGRPGKVTSIVSARRRSPSSASPRTRRRSPIAPSIEARTLLAIAPTAGRSSAGNAPIPRRTPVRRPFLPRTSTSRTSIAATSAAASTAARVSAASVSRSWVSWGRSMGPIDGTACAGLRISEPPIVRDVEGSGRSGCRCSGALRDLHDLRKCSGVPDREVRQDLAIDLDVGGLQALDEAAVGPAVAAHCGVDPDDPQGAHLALPLLPVAGCVGHRMEQGLASRFDQPRAGTDPTLGILEEALVALVGGDAALDSCHEVADRS